MRGLYITSGLFVFSARIVSSLKLGMLCDPSPNYKESWQYNDACEDVYLFCDPATRTCNYKGCSNSDYIQNWDLSLRPYPPRCNGTTFCPDSGSKCTPVAPIGSSCEIQRDDECAGNTAICLNSTCFNKLAPLSGNCGADITIYTTYDQDGDGLQQKIIRDNCTEGTFCDLSGTYTCIPSKPNNSPCEQDRECLSNTCSNNGICINGPDVFHQIKAWLWGVLGTSVVVFVCLILGMLWILHRYQSRKEHAKIVKFFGDNEEFAKYAMMQDNDSNSVFTDSDSKVNLPLNDQRPDVVFLTTPDYLKSQALSKKRSSTNLPRSNNNSTARFSPYQSNNNSQSRVHTPEN